MYLSAEFLNLSGGASDSAFLHGQAKRQMTTEKQLPDAIFQLLSITTVSIDIERNSEKAHIVSFKVKQSGESILFSGMQVREPISKEGLTRRQSFQYLVRKFDKNDLMVVKPSSNKSKIAGLVVQAPDGNTVGYISPQSDNMFDLYDSSGCLLYTTIPNFEDVSCSCLSAKRKNFPPSYEVKPQNSNEACANIEMIGPKGRRNGATLSYTSQLEAKQIVALIGLSVILCTWEEESVKV
ncbi:DgyrCDS1422 [Dimorphilus gyrociliatus]|uniref:DgyrCDS1422 n=1 Tax=Dimorphilus gyrociliatus TaxID=2664684 RepID=A0A7I8V7H1_9ANNE|nr:DgyrCDS1422 [Dimorphilus gyrociliatus]